MVNGNKKDAILAGVNMGQNTDCFTVVAGGIAGTLSGTASIPEQWITQLDYATSINTHTNSKRTIKENFDGIYNEFKSRPKAEKSIMELMDIE